MDRRNFIKAAGLFSTTLVSGCALTQFNTNPDFVRVAAKTRAIKNIPLRHGKSSAGRHKFFIVTSNPDEAHLEFPELRSAVNLYNKPKLTLSLGNALECRRCTRINVYCRCRKISEIIIYTGFGYQPMRCDIPLEYLDDVAKYGLNLSFVDFDLKDADIYDYDEQPNEICFFDFSPTEQPDLCALAPQILVYETCVNLEKHFYENLYSLNSILPFGWMSGCQTEGLHELAKAGDTSAMKALKKHLNYYLDDEKGVVFENPRGFLFENGKFDSVEDFLPFSTIDVIYPNHKATDMFLKWALPSIRKYDNKPITSRFLSTEGCYTFAYPLLRIAANRNDRQLAQTAINETVIRIERLVSADGKIHQRASARSTPVLPNWTRGIAWYMLGLVQILKIVDSHGLGDLNGVDKIRKSFKDSAKYLSQFQRDGYWDCISGLPETRSESSGSMGISASYALGVEAGYLDSSYLDRANLALERFFTPENLEPDGFSKNITQSNRLGVKFQYLGKRIIMQLGSGLAAHIIAVNKRI